MQGEQLPWVPEVRDQLRVLRTYRVLSDKIIPVRQRYSKAPPVLKGTKPVVLGQLTQTQWRAADYPLMEDGEPTDSVYQALHKRLVKPSRNRTCSQRCRCKSVYYRDSAPFKLSTFLRCELPI